MCPQKNVSENTEESLWDVFAQFSVTMKIYYLAIWVERQVWFVDTVQIGYVLLDTENHTKKILQWEEHLNIFFGTPGTIEWTLY